VRTPRLTLSRRSGDLLVTLHDKKAWLCVSVVRQLGWIVEEDVIYCIELHKPTIPVSRAIRIDSVSRDMGYFVSQINQVGRSSVLLWRLGEFLYEGFQSGYRLATLKETL
jgi:hypothetical protein